MCFILHTACWINLVHFYIVLNLWQLNMTSWTLCTVCLLYVCPWARVVSVLYKTTINGKNQIIIVYNTKTLWGVPFSSSIISLKNISETVFTFVDILMLILTCLMFNFQHHKNAYILLLIRRVSPYKSTWYEPNKHFKCVL